MKYLSTFLTALILCSCQSPPERMIFEPGGRIVDGAGRPYNEKRNGKWEFIRPLPKYYDMLSSSPLRGGTPAPVSAPQNAGGISKPQEKRR